MCRIPLISFRNEILNANDFRLKKIQDKKRIIRAKAEALKEKMILQKMKEAAILAQDSVAGDTISAQALEQQLKIRKMEEVANLVEDGGDEDILFWLMRHLRVHTLAFKLYLHQSDCISTLKNILSLS